MFRKRKHYRKWRNPLRRKVKKHRSSCSKSCPSTDSTTTEVSFSQGSLPVSSDNSPVSVSSDNSPVICLTRTTSSDSIIDLTTTSTSHNSPSVNLTSSKHPIDLTISPTTIFDTTLDSTDSDNTLASVDLPVIPCNKNKDLIKQSASHHYAKERDDLVGASLESYSSTNLKKEKTDVTNTKNDDELLSGTPLLFFYGCKSTGANVHEDRIVEIAAEVIEPEKVVTTTKLFCELCCTSRPICRIGCDVMGAIKQEFSDVFPDFLSWIKKCVTEAEEAAEKIFYPVLVTHNGFAFDFQILAAEVERWKLMAEFIKANLIFADTLYELKKIRKTDDLTLNGWSLEEQEQLSIENLHKICFPEQNCFRTHRALEDVQMMIKIFITSDYFSKILQSPTLRSTTLIISDWKRLHVNKTNKQKASHHCKDEKEIQVKWEVKKEGKKADVEVNSNTAAPLGNTIRNATPLLFIYECQTTGGNIHDDHIIEIAAEVIGTEKEFVTVKSFSELCYTTKPILGIGCGVTEEMLAGKRIFFDIFPDFLSWINKCVNEAERGDGKSFYPVLVAHNGFMFDFRILSAEVQRWGMMEQFSTANLTYADTLFELKKMRQTGHPIFNNWNVEGLKLDSILERCFPQQHYFRACRALEDVHSMIAIFTTSELSVVLQSPSLTMRSTDFVISDWNRVHESYRVWKEAQSLYGRCTTRAMAKCLEQNQLNYVRLQEIFTSCSSSPLLFDDMLKTAGVKNITWRKIIWDHFSA